MKTTDFLKMFYSPNSDIEICKLYEKLPNYKSSIGLKDDIYFVAGVKKGLSKRCKDSDIIEKNYFYIDVDIRKDYKEKTGQVLTDDQLNHSIDNIISQLDNNEKFKKYKAIIHTGNGIHIYYIGNKHYQIDKKIYALAVESYIEEFEKTFGIIADKSPKNIARIARLPGSLNNARKIKFGLKPIECKIIKTTDFTSEMIDNMIEKGKELEEGKKLDELIRIGQEQVRLEKSKVGKNDIYEAINQISLLDIVANDYGLQIARDNKNFIGEKKGYEGMFITPDNILINYGSHYLNWATKNGYNTFSYIQEKNNLSAKETFEWFKSQYHHIQELDKENKPKKKAVKEIHKLDNIDSYLDELLKTPTPFSWGLPSIDEMFGRYNREVLNVIVGESGHGKTEFVLQQAEYNSKKTKVCYILLEGSKEELARRRGVKRAGIDLKDWDNRTMSIKQKELFKKEFQRIMNCDYIVSGTFNFNALLEYMQEEVKKGVDIFYIDNMGYIAKDDGVDELEHQKNITRDLKEFAKTNNVAVNLIHHFNKGTSKDRKQARGVASIMGSSKIEHDSNQILIVYRDFEAEVTRLMLEKNREWGDYKAVNIKFEQGKFVDVCPEDFLEEDDGIAEEELPR